MIFAIFLIAVLLVLGGILGLVSALNLIPTDLGLAHFQAGATALAAGLVTLAIGFSTRAVVSALRRVATPRALAAPIERDLPPMMDPAPDRPPRDRPDFALAAGAAAVGAAAGVTLAAAPALAAEPPLVAPEPPAEPDPVIELPPVALPEALDLSAFAETPPPAEPAVEPVAEPAPAPRDPVALAMPELMPIPAPPSFAPQPMPEPPALSIEEEIRAQLGRAPAIEAPPAPEAAPEPPVEPAPVPGLIADADLAALEESKPPLPPLDTLEVVGSYDSGGTRFAMYSDGSVVAVGPEGETRYPTLQDLRRHLDQLSG